MHLDKEMIVFKLTKNWCEGQPEIAWSMTSTFRAAFQPENLIFYMRSRHSIVYFQFQVLIIKDPLTDCTVILFVPERQL